MLPIPSHPLALLVVVATLAALLAMLAPHTRAIDVLRNFVVALVGLCTLLLFGATIGRIVSDFIRDMDGTSRRVPADSTPTGAETAPTKPQPIRVRVCDLGDRRVSAASVRPLRSRRSPANSPPRWSPEVRV